MQFSFNGTTKEITGTYTTSGGKFTASATIDLYSDWKEWVQQGDNAKYLQAFSTTGGDDLGGGTYLGAYFFLENGWKIRPKDEAHRLVITGNLFTRDGTSPFLSTVSAYNVIIEMQNSSLTQQVAGGGGLTAQDIRDAMSLSTAETAQSGSIDDKLNKKDLLVPAGNGYLAIKI